MASLMPEKRVDKNGVIVTRHVKTGGALKTPLLPAPTVDRSTSGTGLMPEQTEPWEIKLERYSFPMRKELQQVLRSGVYSIRLKTNDAVMFEMLSILSPEDAVVLMEKGFNTVADARGFLDSNGVKGVEIDRGEFSREALRRGLSARDLLEMCNRTSTRDADPMRILDAAEVIGMKSIEQRHSIARDVLSGVISIDDIRVIGPEMISDFATGFIQHVLKELKSGKVTLKAAQVRDLAERSLRDDVPLPGLVNLANAFGMDKLDTFTHPEAAGRAVKRVASGAADLDEAYAKTRHFEQVAIACGALTRSDGYPLNWQGMPFELAMEAYDAGVDPSAAAQCYRDDVSLAQYIAIHEHGVAPSVSGGWL